MCSSDLPNPKPQTPNPKPQTPRVLNLISHFMEQKEPFRIVYRLFSYIWDKSPILSRYPLYIPDTIIVEDDLVEWYFTDKSGRIRRKLRENVSRDAVLMALGRKAAKKNCDIVASLVRVENFVELTSETDPKIKQKMLPIVAIEHLNIFELKIFLEGLPRQSHFHGFIQEYIAPSTSNDWVVKVDWTPHVTVCERRTANALLDDFTKPIIVRTSLFEGPAENSTESTLWS